MSAQYFSPDSKICTIYFENIWVFLDSPQVSELIIFFMRMAGTLLSVLAQANFISW